MQALIAYFIVAAAALYAAWLLMPQRARRALVAGLMVVAPSKRAWLARFAANGEHAGCSTCKGCATDKPPSVPGQTRTELRRL
jgi:hypothetical protein